MSEDAELMRIYEPGDRGPGGMRVEAEYVVFSGNESYRVPLDAVVAARFTRLRVLKDGAASGVIERSEYEDIRDNVSLATWAMEIIVFEESQGIDSTFKIDAKKHH